MKELTTYEILYRLAGRLPKGTYPNPWKKGDSVWGMNSIPGHWYMFEDGVECFGPEGWEDLDAYMRRTGDDPLTQYCPSS